MLDRIIYVDSYNEKQGLIVNHYDLESFIDQLQAANFRIIKIEYQIESEE